VHFLYLRLAPEVDSCVRGLLGSDCEAEELTLWVFADLGARIADYEESEEPFVSWLVTIAQSRAREYANHHPHAGALAG